MKQRILFSLLFWVIAVVSWGPFKKLHEESQQKLRAIIEAAAANPGKIEGSDEQKIGDFFAS